MRVFFSAWSALAAAILLGCGTERLPQATEPQRPTVVTAINDINEFVVTAAELPGSCTLEGESEFIVREYSRSFNCAGALRVTNSVGVRPSVALAEQEHDRSWSTLNGARALIQAAVRSRPTQPDSLQIEDLSGRLVTLGADQEHVYCASYTDAGGTTRITEIYGAYRYRYTHVTYSAFTTAPDGSCTGGSPAHDAARALAQLQFQKLRRSLPAGDTPPSVPTTSNQSPAPLPSGR